MYVRVIAKNVLISIDKLCRSTGEITGSISHTYTHTQEATARASPEKDAFLYRYILQNRRVQELYLLPHARAYR